MWRTLNMMTITETTGDLTWQETESRHSALAASERRELRDLDRYLCRSLGMRMVRLSQSADTWPESIAPSLQEWCLTLREHGDVLVWYSERELSDEYEALAAAYEENPDDEKLIEKLKLAAYDRDELDTARAQSSLRWVSDVLPNLWG
jgi:hypothetical protein